MRSPPSHKTATRSATPVRARRGADLLSLRKTIVAFIAVLGTFLAAPATAQENSQERSIVVASTTSTVDTGLFNYLLPLFTHKTGIAVNVLRLGTGQALDAGRRGEADVVFVHAKFAELRFITEGDGVRRFPVMYDDFVLVGPKSDPAGIQGMDDVTKALQTIKDKQVPFISRGDRSGTHFAELALWYKDSGIYIEKEEGSWYRSVGKGMNETLDVALAERGYVLADRGTWVHFKNKDDLQVLVEGDRRMFNQYSAILVNPDKHPNVKKELGQAFIDWLVSPEGQNAIAGYKIDGEQLFFPNANDPRA